ncbi:MAG: energy transducer TonB [Bacteroidales bacterium]|nr:energy transducer TonB [Bacteroidales bacterium]
MNHGKQTCKILKEIRKQIAEKNDIAFVTKECRHKGDCAGTCPACEAEVRYLEQELRKRQRLGKTAIVAGLSVGLMSALPSGLSAQVNNGSKPVAPQTEQQSQTNVRGNVGGSQTVVDGQRIVPPDTSTCVIVGYTPPVFNEAWVVSPSSYDTPPRFVGDDIALQQYLKRNLNFEEINKYQMTGTVVVLFNVDKNGFVRRPTIIRPLFPPIDNEILRVIRKMPQWIPAQKDGEPVYSSYELPVTIGPAE